MRRSVLTLALASVFLLAPDVTHREVTPLPSGEGHIETITDVNGNTLKETTFDASGKPTARSTKDPKTGVEVDEDFTKGRVTRRTTTNADESEVVEGFDSKGRPTTTVNRNPEGDRTGSREYTYGKHGIEAIKDKDKDMKDVGRITYTRDGKGNLTTVSEERKGADGWKSIGQIHLQGGKIVETGGDVGSIVDAKDGGAIDLRSQLGGVKLGPRTHVTTDLNGTRRITTHNRDNTFELAEILKNGRVLEHGHISPAGGCPERDQCPYEDASGGGQSMVPNAPDGHRTTIPVTRPTIDPGLQPGGHPAVPVGNTPRPSGRY